MKVRLRLVYSLEGSIVEIARNLGVLLLRYTEAYCCRLSSLEPHGKSPEHLYIYTSYSVHAGWVGKKEKHIDEDPTLRA